jgi:hypothetical protein
MKNFRKKGVKINFIKKNTPVEPARNPLGGSMELMTLSITSATEEEKWQAKEHQNGFFTSAACWV